MVLAALWHVQLRVCLPGFWAWGVTALTRSSESSTPPGLCIQGFLESFHSHKNSLSLLVRVSTIVIPNSLSSQVFFRVHRKILSFSKLPQYSKMQLLLFSDLSLKPEGVGRLPYTHRQMWLIRRKRETLQNNTKTPHVVLSHMRIQTQLWCKTVLCQGVWK